MVSPRCETTIALASAHAKHRFLSCAFFGGDHKTHQKCEQQWMGNEQLPTRHVVHEKGANLLTHISTKNRVVTLINVFKVDPAHQQRLVELLTHATDVSVRHAPGFVSASLHRSTDGTKVTMYAQWRSVEDYQAMRQDPTPLPFLEEALTIASFDPGMYEVVQTFAPFDGQA